jgi:hypothetical protein
MTTSSKAAPGHRQRRNPHLGAFGYLLGRA